MLLILSFSSIFHGPIFIYFFFFFFPFFQYHSVSPNYKRIPITRWEQHSANCINLHNFFGLCLFFLLLARSLPILIFGFSIPNHFMSVYIFCRYLNISIWFWWCALLDHICARTQYRMHFEWVFSHTITTQAIVSVWMNKTKKKKRFK